MDMKRFTEIESREALERLSNGMDVFNSFEQRYCIENNKHVRYFKDSQRLESNLTINEILSEKWFVKKPFDVRAEMLARPNEWVAAYKIGDKWMKVGFRTELMYPVTTWRWELSVDECIPQAFKYEIDECIPIEDVPKEEL